MCNAENVHVLREFRANCRVLIALGVSARGSASRVPVTTRSGRVVVGAAACAMAALGDSRGNSSSAARRPRRWVVGMVILES